MEKSGILVTAIGSMSATCVISKLKESGNYVVGCDIYPGEWHTETFLCDKFYQVPYATEYDRYVQTLLDICKAENLGCIIPLTDLEIDVINSRRGEFEKAGLTLCMQSSETLEIARNKYKLFKAFENDGFVPVAKTSLLTEPDPDIAFPCIAKPYNGRSSEGLIRNATKEQLDAICDKDVYIIQEQLDGEVFTVDYCRSEDTGRDCAVPRVELLRTKNGAGTTVKTVADESLVELVSHIGGTLHINGCVNMEFIHCDNKYYLIDLNPRFSAGVAFSVLSGYDMIDNHIRCFQGEDIDGQISLQERIIIKKFVEEIVCPKTKTNR